MDTQGFGQIIQSAARGAVAIVIAAIVAAGLICGGIGFAIGKLF